MKSRGHYQESRLRSGARWRDHINKPCNEPVRATRRNSVRSLTETDSSFAKTPPAFDFLVPHAKVNKKMKMYNMEQTPLRSHDSFEMLRIHRFSGASMAMGRTGSRELFLPSDGFDATSPPKARRPEQIGKQTSAFAHPLCP